ncbi:snoaL-like polyketide cyclase domain-containing protein [Sarocladium implicatum]|nr:snoaL-like polyketide cyclase domain-containing protein [Sarocladium implicatum]
MSASEVITKLVAGLNARDSAALGDLTSESLLINGHEEPRSQFVATVLKLAQISPDISTTIDTTVISTNGDSGFVRCIHRMTLTQPTLGYEPRTVPSEFLETIFVRVVDGKLVEINTISELKAFAGIKNLDEEVKRVKSIEVQPVPEGVDLRANYEAFVACLNDRSIQEREVAARFFCETVMHNGVDISLDDSLGYLRKTTTVIEDQKYNLQEVIVDTEKQQIATHVVITGTPRKPLYGVEPTGKGVEFPAHIVYQLSGGKFRQIYNLSDVKAYRDCLEKWGPSLVAIGE